MHDRRCGAPRSPDRHGLRRVRAGRVLHDRFKDGVSDQVDHILMAVGRALGRTGGDWA